MRSMLFCTAFFRSPEEWRARYARWIAHHARVPLGCEAVFLIDDASPMPCPDPTVTVLAALPETLPPGRVYLYRFGEHLGRAGPLSFPGWWRSFFFAETIATRYGFEKIVHVESDAYVLSLELASYIEALQSGWTALWTPCCKFPETQFQVICSDAFTAMRALGSRADELRGKPPEHVFPFTHVERDFTGDRYGVLTREIPPEADYSGDVRADMAVWFRGSVTAPSNGTT